MHSPNATLVRMANDIANFFHPQGEEKAIAGIANHIRLFWEPRMKKQIFAHLDEGGEGLKPLALKALQKLKADMHGFSTAAEAKAAAEAIAMGDPVPQPQPVQQQKAKASGNGKRAKS
ncbi:formate dehydrogenase subunit delta [Hyphomicrobium sp.]|uniref:formate dehydrogenase subunit delta n=1 Tax=Hyphomicrobium sp. TaxID=82 RepID=UPI003D0E58B0